MSIIESHISRDDFSAFATDYFTRCNIQEVLTEAKKLHSAI